jgi:hypothetical protein
MRGVKLRSLMVMVCLSTIALVACSSSNGDASSDPASCSVVITSYDQTCTQDSDCVGAPPGGDACGECHQLNPAFACTLAAINVNDSARYTSDIAKALENQGAPAENCGTSCPIAVPAKCVDHTCKLVAASVDAGN